MRHILPNYLKIPVWHCPICKQGFQSESPCGKCRTFFEPVSPGTLTDGTSALFTYNDAAKDLIYGIKYENILSPLGWLAKQLASKAPKQTDFVTWIPASPVQRARRGYDQGRLIAKAVSAVLKKPCLQMLKRKIDTPQSRKKGDRYGGPDLYLVRHFFPAKPANSSFKPRSKKSIIQSARILLLDDVITTGTSIRIGKELLESAGALEVHPFGIAATLRKSPNPRTMRSF